MSRRKRWLVLIPLLLLVTAISAGCGSTANQREIDELRSRVAALQESLAWTQQQLLSAQAAISEAQRQNIQLQSEVREAVEQCSQVQQTISSATRDTSALCSPISCPGCHGYYPYHVDYYDRYLYRSCNPYSFTSTIRCCNLCGTWYVSERCPVCIITPVTPKPDSHRYSPQPRSDTRKPPLPDRTKPYNQLILQDADPPITPESTINDPATESSTAIIAKSQTQTANAPTFSVSTVDPVANYMQADSNPNSTGHLPKANAGSSGITRTQISSTSTVAKAGQNMQHTFWSTTGHPPVLYIDGGQLGSALGQRNRQPTNDSSERLRVLDSGTPREDQELEKLETN